MGIKQDSWRFQNKRINKVHESKTKAEATAWLKVRTRGYKAVHYSPVCYSLGSRGTSLQQLRGCENLEADKMRAFLERVLQAKGTDFTFNEVWQMCTLLQPMPSKVFP